MFQYIYIYIHRFYVYLVYCPYLSICKASSIPAFLSHRTELCPETCSSGRNKSANIFAASLCLQTEKISLDFSECLTAYVPEPLCRTYNPKHPKHLGFSNTDSC